MVGGDGLARGYLGHPDLTAVRFVPDEWSWDSTRYGSRYGPDALGTRRYRSGDLARYRPGGEMEYLGRSDSQVKIRGFRIELGEIESALNRHPGIEACAVVVSIRENGEKLLAAYVVCGATQSSPTTSDLRGHLLERLPDYMVPAAFVFLEALPITANGKLDRQALPAADRARSLEEKSGEPETPAESALAGIWREALHVERVGVNDNYFELGGDSIISIQIVSKARDAGLYFTPREIFERPTISQLALGIANEGDFDYGAIPLTPIQHWFFDQKMAEPHHYNQAVILELNEDTSCQWVREAFEILVKRHQAMRFRYHPAETGWEQRCARQEADFVHFLNLSAIPAGEQAAEFEMAVKAAQASLDLQEGPLVRVIHIVAGEDQPPRLLIVIHHLAIDGVSWRILFGEDERIRVQMRKGEPVSLPAATPFGRWAQQLARYAESEELSLESAYWAKITAERANPLPRDFDQGLNLEGSTRRVKISLNEGHTRRLVRDMPIAYGSRINEVLLAAVALALRKWLNEPQVLIEVEGHGREEIAASVDVSGTIGWFTTTYPVSFDLSAGGSSIEALEIVKRTLRETPNNGIGFGLLGLRQGDSTSTECSGA
ncbi:MAG: condensation domain-containing protein, partial [Blastocatellia bacterium]